MSTAVVLSGGGSLGAVQVGMLRALAEAEIVPDVVVGTSVGALNGAFVAGRPWPNGLDELTQVWCSLRRADVFPATPLGVLRAAAGRSNHVVSDRGLRRLLDRHLTYGRLQDAAVPIFVVATEVPTGREIVLRDAPAADAVLASASLPGILPPVTIDGHALIDGGLVDNIPISVAADLGVDSIIVLPTGYACALPAPPRGALAMALHAVTLAIQRRLIDHARNTQQRLDLRVAPPLCPLSVSPVDFTQARQLIDRAHKQTAAWLDRPRRQDQAAELGLHAHGQGTVPPRPRTIRIADPHRHRAGPNRRSPMTSFATDVRPLFRDKDVQSMKSMFDLSRYQDVKDNADGILETVANASMPCDQTWSPEQIATLRAWINEGFPQ